MNSTLEPIIKEHPFFVGLEQAEIEALVECADSVRFKAGELVAREGDPADQFFLIREGRMSIGLPARQGGFRTIETLDAGELVGWSWLFPPHVWHFDVRTVTDLSAITIDGRSLRYRCEENPRMGYDLMKRFSSLVVERLSATRIQLLDVYSVESGSSTPK